MIHSFYYHHFIIITILFMQGKNLSTKVDSFLNGSNSIYVEQMYDAWLKDPKRYYKSRSVHINKSRSYLYDFYIYV